MNKRNFFCLVIALVSSCTHQVGLDDDHNSSNPVYDGQVLVPMPPVDIE